MKRNLLLTFLVVGFAIAPVMSAHAEFSLMRFLFPTLTSTEPDPGETLTAPFAKPPADANAVKPSLPENSTPLDHAHRNSEQIGEWLEIVASETMTFEGGNYEGAVSKVAHYFDEGGRQQYMEFLSQSGLTGVLQGGKYNIRGFVHEKPILLNEGAIEKRYRWLFEVPVMITYMDRGMKNYKGVPQPASQNLKLNIQVGRTGNLDIGNDLIIERWSGTIQPKK